MGFVGRASRLAGASLKGSFRVALLGPRMLIGKDTPQKLISELHAATAKELLETLGRLKGAAMKVGQLASFIDAGVLPPEVRDMYQDVFASLRDAAPPMKPKLVGQVFAAEFGATPDELFGAFDIKPAAAASLGQVHHAVTKDGREVAVKVQYPGIEEAIHSDLAMTAVVKPLLPLLAPGLDVDDAMEEIKARVLEELDYVLEAQTLDLLAAEYEHHPFVRVPRSVPELTTARVLTMDRIVGTPFSQMKKLPVAERNVIGEILFRFYWGSLHRYGFTSADPHPGNYLRLEDGRMGFFDFGLSCRLDPRISPNMVAGLIALRDGDVGQFFEQGIAMGYVRRPRDVSPDQFYEWARLSLAPIAEDRDYKFTRDFIVEITTPMLDPRNPWWGFIRRLNVPRWGILFYRLQLGLFAVLAQLGAQGNWHRMMMEFYGECDASTELGVAEEEWMTSKGPSQHALPPIHPAFDEKDVGA